jgi:hypothetical protein
MNYLCGLQPEMNFHGQMWHRLFSILLSSHVPSAKKTPTAYRPECAGGWALHLTSLESIESMGRMKYKDLFETKTLETVVVSQTINALGCIFFPENIFRFFKF